MGAITGGVTGSLSTTVISAGSPATLTLTAASNASLGTYPILVNGIATTGTITHSVLAVLGVAISTSPGGTSTAGGTVTIGTVAVPPGAPAGITVSSPVLLGPNQAVCSMSQGSTGITAMPNVLGQTITFTATSSAVPATATCATGAPEPAPQYVQVPCIPEDLIDLSVTSDSPGIWDFDVSSDDPDVFVTSMLVSIQTRTPSGQYTPYSLSAPPNGDNDFTVYWAPGAPCGIYNVAMAYFDDDYDDGPIFANASAYLCYEGPPPCTPSVSSIQVNASQTNTLILGTTGTLVINGTCLENATGVGAAGAGVNVGTITQNTNDLVTAVYQSTSLGSPTLGYETVTLQTENGSSYGQIFAVAVSLTSFSFTGSVPYSRDCEGNASPIAAPSWPASTKDANGNPPACLQQLGYTGDHAVYYAGETMTGTAVFSVNPAPPQAVPGVYVEAGTAAGTFSGAGTIAAGYASFSAPVTDNAALPTSQTQFYAPLNASWSVGQAGGPCSTGGCVAVGASSNPVYVTLAQNVLPSWAMPVMLTYVALAAGTGGATSQSAALANTWAQFSTGSGPANVQTWDRRSMNYYSAGFTSCALNASYVVQNLIGQPPASPTIAPYNSAQCGAFALLLESALAMNGIHSNWTQIQAKGYALSGQLMVINNWCPIGSPGCPSGSPTYPSNAPWQYNFLLNPGADMVPALSSYGDLTNCTGPPTGCNGLPGQGSYSYPLTGSPLEKVFGSHFIVQIPIASGNQYYDPSYGVTYLNEAGFESQAVVGYAQQMVPDARGSGNYHFCAVSGTPICGSSGTPNVTFTIVYLPSSPSM
jgi:hypothetical protein